jgi:acyl carrier protein
VGSNINIKDTLNADGAGMTQMADALEKVFGICIAYDDAEQFTTIQDVIDYVGSKVWWYNP